MFTVYSNIQLQTWFMRRLKLLSSALAWQSIKLTHTPIKYYPIITVAFPPRRILFALHGGCISVAVCMHDHACSIQHACQYIRRIVVIGMTWGDCCLLAFGTPRVCLFLGSCKPHWPVCCWLHTSSVMWCDLPFGVVDALAQPACGKHLLHYWCSCLSVLTKYIIFARGPAGSA